MNSLNCGNVNKRHSKRKSSIVLDDAKKTRNKSDLFEMELEDESSMTSSKLNNISINVNNNSILKGIENLLKASLYECKKCNITCFNKIKHLMTNHIEQNIRCERCYEDIVLENYAVHFSSCQNILKYSCKICNGKFCDPQTLNNHKKSCQNKTHCKTISKRNGSNETDIESPELNFLTVCEVKTTDLPDSPKSATIPLNNKCRQITNKGNALYNEKIESNRKQMKSDKTQQIKDNIKVKSKENEYENLEISLIMINPECDSDNFSEEDPVLLSTEMSEILEIYNNRNTEEINRMYNDIQIPEYECLQDAPGANLPAQYDCHACLDFSTAKFEEFYDHLLEHHKSISKKKETQLRSNCMICGGIVPRNDLLAHVRMHRNHIQCNICKNYVLQDIFESHLTEHKKHFSCRICGDIYKSVPAIRKHMTHHKKNVSYSCDKCNLVFCSLQKLICHISLVHKSIVMDYAECIFCLELTQTIKCHTYTADACKLKCKICLKCMKTAQEYADHFRGCVPCEQAISSSKKKMLNVYKCKICGKKSRSYVNANEHVEAHKIDSSYEKHMVRQQRVTCTICQYEIPQQYIQVHNEKHLSNERCERCSQFVAKDKIINHLERYHSTFKCVECEETFPTMKELENHRYAHGKLVQRQCNYCQLNFNSEISRIKHMSFIHKRVDPEFVECNYCNELISDQIEYHILNPSNCQFRCKLCNRRFANLQCYKSHVDTEHKDILRHK